MKPHKSSEIEATASHFFAELPRQTPGNASCAQKILNAVRFDMPAKSCVLDLGCGTGAQTSALLDTFSDASIRAVDTNPDYIQKLHDTLPDSSLERVKAEVADFKNQVFKKNHYHLIWSEAGLYTMGVQKALAHFKQYLTEGGFLIFSHLTWLVDEPSREIKAYWQKHFPDMPTLVKQMGLVQQAGYDLLEIQVLPETVWWESYYNPIKEALPQLESLETEPARELARHLKTEIEMYLKYGAEYSYVYYALKWTS